MTLGFCHVSPYCQKIWNNKTHWHHNNNNNFPQVDCCLIFKKKINDVWPSFCQKNLLSTPKTTLHPGASQWSVVSSPNSAGWLLHNFWKKIKHDCFPKKFFLEQIKSSPPGTALCKKIHLQHQKINLHHGTVPLRGGLFCPLQCHDSNSTAGWLLLNIFLKEKNRTQQPVAFPEKILLGQKSSSGAALCKNNSDTQKNLHPGAALQCNQGLFLPLAAPWQQQHIPQVGCCLIKKHDQQHMAHSFPIFFRKKGPHPAQHFTKILLWDQK